MYIIVHVHNCTCTCFLPSICLWQILQIQIYFYVVVGSGFVSTSLAYMRSSASHPVGPHGHFQLYQNSSC